MYVIPTGRIEYRWKYTDLYLKLIIIMLCHGNKRLMFFAWKVNETCDWWKLWLKIYFTNKDAIQIWGRWWLKQVSGVWISNYVPRKNCENCDWNIYFTNKDAILIWGSWYLKQVSRVWISNYVPRNTAGCGHCSHPRFLLLAPQLLYVICF